MSTGLNGKTGEALRWAIGLLLMALVSYLTSLGAVQTRLAVSEIKIANVEKKVDNVETKVDRVDDKLDRLSIQLREPPAIPEPNPSDRRTTPRRMFDR